MNVLFEVVREVQAFLRTEGWSNMLVGGLAVQFWGRVRATRDVDIVIAIDPNERSRLVATVGEKFTIVPSDPGDFIAATNVLPIETESGVEVDIICAWTEMERQAIRRAKEIEMEPGFSISICTPEDLAVLKFISDRQLDREDVIGILIRSGNIMDHTYVKYWLSEFARTLNQSHLVTEYDSLLVRYV